MGREDPIEYGAGGFALIALPEDLFPEFFRP
jgi:hypothetical protein